MKPIIYRAGGKNSLLKITDFTRYFPRMHRYIETFCGGMVVAVRVNANTYLMNDLSNETMNFWFQLSKHADEFYERAKYVFRGMEYTYPIEDDIDRAVVYWLKSTNSSPRIVVKSTRTDLDARIEVWRKWLDTHTVVFLNRDPFDFVRDTIHGREIIPTVWYHDPPYIGNNVDWHHTDKGPMPPFDHERYAALLRECAGPDHRMFVSYGDHDEVRRLYDGWYFMELGTVKYAKTAKSIAETTIRTELLISDQPFVNYKQKCVM